MSRPLRQTYYGVDSQLYRELDNKLSSFRSLTKELFNPAASQERKLAAKAERDCLHDSIQSKLSKSAVILGFLTMEQVDDLRPDIEAVADPGIREKLGSNHISYDELENVIGALCQSASEGTGVSGSVIFFLERAKQNKQHVIVWMK